MGRYAEQPYCFNLRRLRIGYGLSEEEMANIINVPLDVYRYKEEHAEAITLSDCILIIKELNLTPIAVFK